jgi:cysteinyl-tRNA synthetase
VTATGRADGTASVTGDSAVPTFVVGPEGTYSTDESTQARIDDLITRRKAARMAKDFARADKFRDELAALGVVIKDNKDGATTWEPRR